MTRYNLLQERLQALGVNPKKSLGQNFLIEGTVIDKILAVVEKRNADTIVEIGPGLGALTDQLVQLKRPLLLLELDKVFAEYWRNRNMDVSEGDALHFDWQQFKSKNICLVSNLPYQISSSLVIDRAMGPISVQSMVLMFQKEVAERILAPAKTEDYGILSVIAQSFFTVERVVDASPACFFPKPKIASRVLAFDRKSTALQDMAPYFIKFVKVAFAQRRKKLINNLKVYRNVDEAFAKKQISINIRAEQLTPLEFEGLFFEVFGEH